MERIRNLEKNLKTVNNEYDKYKNQVEVKIQENNKIIEGFEQKIKTKKDKIKDLQNQLATKATEIEKTKLENEHLK